MMEVNIIRKVNLSMDEQKKYEVIKSLTDHSNPNNQRAALILGCTVRHINRMIKGYRELGKEYFIHGNRGRKPANTIPESTRSLVAVEDAHSRRLELSISVSWNKWMPPHMNGFQDRYGIFIWPLMTQLDA